MQIDKLLHILAGIAIAAISFPLGAWQAAALGVAAGAGKEAYDWLANRRAAERGEPIAHGVEWLDFAATSAGAGLIAGWLHWLV